LCVYWFWLGKGINLTLVHSRLWGRFLIGRGIKWRFLIGRGIKWKTCVQVKPLCPNLGKMRTGVIKRWFFNDTSLQPDFPGGRDQEWNLVLICNKKEGRRSS
jgi:hypothetical protein